MPRDPADVCRTGTHSLTIHVRQPAERVVRRRLVVDVPEEGAVDGTEMWQIERHRCRGHAELPYPRLSVVTLNPLQLALLAARHLATRAQADLVIRPTQTLGVAFEGSLMSGIPHGSAAPSSVNPAHPVSQTRSRPPPAGATRNSRSPPLRVDAWLPNRVRFRMCASDKTDSRLFSER